MLHFVSFVARVIKDKEEEITNNFLKEKFWNANVIAAKFEEG